MTLNGVMIANARYVVGELLAQTARVFGWHIHRQVTFCTEGG